MKAAVVTGPNRSPEFGEFDEPAAGDGVELITVSASALTSVTRARASGAHYSGTATFPLVPGFDGVGVDPDGQRVLFLMPEAPFGAMAERVAVRQHLILPLPDGIDDVTAAAIINPGMSAVAALRHRAVLRPGETVFINGATGAAGQLAVQIAKHLGAARVIAAGRDADALARLREIGADATVSLLLDHDQLIAELGEQLTAEGGVDVVLDYLAGPPAETLLATLTSTYKGEHPVRYVFTGGASGKPVTLTPPILASVPVSLMGSGIGSIPFARFLEAASEAVTIAAEAGLVVDHLALPLSDVTEAWNGRPGRGRVVFTTR